LTILLQIKTNDLRDIDGDSHEGIKSFTVLLGDNRARLSGFIMVAFGFYFGLDLFKRIPLVIFSVFLIFRTILYKKEGDIYWQLSILVQVRLMTFMTPQ